MATASGGRVTAPTHSPPAVQPGGRGQPTHHGGVRWSGHQRPVEPSDSRRPRSGGGARGTDAVCPSAHHRATSTGRVQKNNKKADRRGETKQYHEKGDRSCPGGGAERPVAQRSTGETVQRLRRQPRRATPWPAPPFLRPPPHHHSPSGCERRPWAPPAPTRRPTRQPLVPASPCPA